MAVRVVQSYWTYQNMLKLTRSVSGDDFIEPEYIALFRSKFYIILKQEPIKSQQWHIYILQSLYI